MTVRTEYLDQAPRDWFVLDVMRKEARKRDWVMLMIDVDPDDFVKNSSLKAHSQWVLIPGKNKSLDAARDAAKNMIASRH